MLIALLPQYEKEAMGVVVGVGALVATIGPLRSGRYPGRPTWSPRTTRLVAVAAVAAGAAIAVASFLVNVEPETYWGDARDRALFAGWLAVVGLIAALSVRRARRSGAEAEVVERPGRGRRSRPGGAPP